MRWVRVEARQLLKGGGQIEGPGMEIATLCRTWVVWGKIKEKGLSGIEQGVFCVKFISRTEELQMGYIRHRIERSQ